MPRRHRRRPEADPGDVRPPRTMSPLPAPPGWTAHRHRAAGSGPDYVCPRCARPVRRTSDHVVAWITDTDESHRHWHTGCWEAAVREGIDRYRWS